MPLQQRTTELDTPTMIDNVIGPYRLRITTGTFELRLVRPDELAHLAAIAHQPLYEDEPKDMLATLSGEWAETTPDCRARTTVQGHMAALGAWHPDDWQCPFGVWRDHDLLGVQSLNARDFAATRTVYTGSWLGLEHQGRGTGTAMRLAVLAFAFNHLGATTAWSRASQRAVASARISEKLGYEYTGDEVETNRQGQPRS